MSTLTPSPTQHWELQAEHSGKRHVDGIRVGKEDVTPSLFADGKTLPIGNHQVSTEGLFQTLNKRSRAAGSKINVQEPVAFHMPTMKHQKNK